MTQVTRRVVLSTTFVLVIGPTLLVDASSSSSSDLASMVSTHSSSCDSITITAAPTTVQSPTGTPPASSSGLESWQKTLIIVGSILLAFFALMAFLNYKCNQDDAAHSTARSSKQNNNKKNQAREIDPDECPHAIVEMECPPSGPSDGVKEKSAKPVLTASAFEKYAKQDNSPRKEQGVGTENDPTRIDTTLGWVQEQQQHYEPVFPPPIPSPSPISHSSVEVVESTSRPRRTSSQKQQQQQHPPLTVAESILFGTAPKDTKAAGGRGAVGENDSKKKQRSYMKRYDAVIMDVSVEQLDVDLTSGDEDHHDHSKAQVLSPSPKNNNKLQHDERIEGDFEDEFVTDLNQPQYEQQPQEVFSRYHDNRKKDDDVLIINEDPPSFRTVDTYHSTTGSQADPSFVVSEERSELPPEEGNHHHFSSNNNNLALSQSMIEIENPSSPTKCRLRRKASRSTTATVTSSMRTNPTTDHTSSFCSSTASGRNEGEAIAPEDLSGFGVEPSAAAHAPTTVTKRTSSLVPSRSVYGGRSTPSSALHATNLAAAARAPPSATYPQTPSFLRVPKTGGNGQSMKK